ncbi:MAG: hypothetical protein GY868_03520 [Deltaproteobacteria bacterium]|nr:hypothetical protein [Deltaproteobacteria bacterium]
MSCKHEILRLVPPTPGKLRCRHCHLVISEQEIGDGYCPECLEVSKIRRKDFDQIEAENAGTVRYCCEGCGMVVDC